MDKLVSEMITKGLASIEQREILPTLPVWFASLSKYTLDWLDIIEYIKFNKN